MSWAQAVYPGGRPPRISMTVYSRWKDANTDNGWGYDVVPTDDPVSEAEVSLGKLRADMFAYSGVGAERVDILTRGLTESGPLPDRPYRPYFVEVSTSRAPGQPASPYFEAL